MDFSKLSNGAKLVLGGTVAFLIVSFFNWQEIEIANIASAGRSMWAGWGTLAGLLAIALLVWEVLKLANVNISLPVTPAMTSAFLAILMLIATVLKVLTDNEFRTFWAWLGLLLAIAVTVGAVMTMKEAGQDFSDMRQTLSAGAAAATAAARSATDSARDATSSAPDAAPAAPAAPEETHDAMPSSEAAEGAPDEPDEHRPA